jgi:hypothetical protein
LGCALPEIKEQPLDTAIKYVLWINLRWLAMSSFDTSWHVRMPSISKRFQFFYGVLRDSIAKEKG